MVVWPRRDRQVLLPRRRARADQPIEEQVARCAGIKAAIVSEDEREGGRRAILNYGHTLAPRPRGSRHVGSLRLGPPAWRSGGDRAALRRAPGRTPRPHRHHAGRGASSGDRQLRPLDRPPARCGLGGTGYLHGPRQEGAAGFDLRARRAGRGRACAWSGGVRRCRYPCCHGCALREPRAALVRAEPQPARRARACRVRDRHAGRPREAGRSGGGTARPRARASADRTTRASSSTPSTGRGVGQTRW